jgi:hypothetical protein
LGVELVTFGAELDFRELEVLIGTYLKAGPKRKHTQGAEWRAAKSLGSKCLTEEKIGQETETIGELSLSGLRAPVPSYVALEGVSHPA